MAPLIAEIANPVERGHYVQALARLVQADERLIAGQVAAVGRGVDLGRKEAAPSSRASERTAPRRDQPSNETGPKAASAASTGTRPILRKALSGLEEYILGWLFLRPDLLADLDADMIGQQAPPLEPEDFGSSESRALLAVLQANHELPEDAGPEDRLAELPGPLRDYAQRAVADVLGKPPLPDKN